MSLTEEDLRGIIMQALRDEDRGFGMMQVMMREDALAHLVNVANGDARAVLNALELAVTTTPPQNGIIDITLEVAEESIQQRAVLYDKEGDAHFDTISAFIKSIRGSDPDAALYWLARMVQAGESPNFIFRRLLISACEDIGMADPNAVGIVNACAQAFDRIGLPEGRYHLAHATIYLATAPKSNSSMAFFDALSVVQKETSYDVPNPLKDASRDKDGLGHGHGYLYPHAYRDHWVAQQYLPDGLQGRIFYHPTTMGYEASIAQKVERNREAQLALFEERRDTDASSEERWIGRTFDGGAARAQAIRDEIFQALNPAPNARILDIHAASGLLTFEAMRKCPDGGVFSLTLPSPNADNFEALMNQRPELERAQIARLEAITPQTIQAFAHIEFDGIIGRNFLHLTENLPELLQTIRQMLAPNGKAVITNVLPNSQPRISQLQTQSQHLDPHLLNAWHDAEERILQDEQGFQFTPQTLETAAAQIGLPIRMRMIELSGALTITPAVFNHWFAHNPTTPSYIDKLATHLSKESCDALTQWAHVYLRAQTVSWPSTVLMIQF